MKFLQKFFNLLNKEEIQYSVLRNYEKLPKSTGGSDLDLLIHEKDMLSFYNFIRNYRHANSKFLCSFIPAKFSCKLCFINKKCGVQIDVFEASVLFGDKEIVSSRILFNNTVEYSGIKVLKKELATLLSFLKEILNNQTCQLKYIRQLKNQFIGRKIPPEYLSQFSNDFYIYLNDNLSSLDSQDCLRLYKLAKKNFSKSVFTGLSYKIKRFYKQPGYTIVILGTDGSGKSTIIKEITPTLNDAFHNAVYYEHLRPNYFPSIAALFGRKSKQRGPVTNPHGSTSSGFVGSLFRWAYYLLDYTIGFFLKIWPKKAIRSCVWIFDRYYYDYLIDPKRSRVNLPQWLLKVGQFIIPEPDIILCLGTDPQIIHERKPELPLAEVERQVRALQAFCTEHPRAKWINTGKHIDESSNEALEYIIQVMARRFEDVEIVK